MKNNSIINVTEIKKIKEAKELNKENYNPNFIILFYYYGEIIYIQCSSKDKFKDVSLKFENEIGKEKDYEYIYKGNLINKNKTLFELNIKDNSAIVVYEYDYEEDEDENKKKEIEKKEEIKKYDLNILYYDENIKNKENNEI